LCVLTGYIDYSRLNIACLVSSVWLIHVPVRMIPAFDGYTAWNVHGDLQRSSRPLAVDAQKDPAPDPRWGGRRIAKVEVLRGRSSRSGLAGLRQNSAV
jgi:hypothetical protein